MDITKLNVESEDLRKTLDEESEKHDKLVTIAQEKYKMKLDFLDNYLPKDHAYLEKMRSLEKRKILEAQRQKKDIKVSQRQAQEHID